MSNKNEKRSAVMEVLSKYDLDSSAVWDCHGTPVILHKALEHIQVVAGISFDDPQIIEASGKDKVVALWVRGSLDTRSEWSIGEAAPSNNKNSYPYAMAEKRAKDRVILKLINLHGLAYSEDEADDFRAANPNNKQAQKKQANITPGPDFRDQKDFKNLPAHIKPLSTYEMKKRGLYESLCERLAKDCTEPKHVGHWVRETLEEIALIPQPSRHYFYEEVEAHKELLETGKAA